MDTRQRFTNFAIKQFVLLLVLLALPANFKIQSLIQPSRAYDSAVQEWRTKRSDIRKMNNLWKMIDGAKRLEASGVGLLAKDLRDAYINPTEGDELKKAQRRLEKGADSYENIDSVFYGGKLFVGKETKKADEYRYELTQAMQVAIQNYHDGGLDTVLVAEPKRPNQRDFPTSSVFVKFFSWPGIFWIGFIWLVMATVAYFAAHVVYDEYRVVQIGSKPPFPNGEWFTISPEQPGLHLLILFLALPTFLLRAVPMVTIRVLPGLYFWFRDVYWALIRDERSSIIQRLRQRNPERNIYSGDIRLLNQYVAKLNDIIARRPALAEEAGELKTTLQRQITALEGRPISDEAVLDYIGRHYREADIPVAAGQPGGNE